MNIQQLETFIRVADNLNFARAAEELNMTQSAVSRQIHALEDELGARLLLRTTRAVTLTAAGISFLEDAKKVVATVRGAVAKIEHNPEANIPVVSVGCRSEAELDFLCGVLKRCRKQEPQLHPFLKVVPQRFAISLLLQGDIDLLFGFRDDTPLRGGVAYTELAQLPLCCVFSETHPLYAQSGLKESELYTQSIILCNAVPSKASALQERTAAHIPPEKMYLCENLMSALTLVRAGYGFTIAPKIEFNSSEIKFVPLQGEPPLSYGMFRKSGGLSPHVRSFVSMVKENA